MGAGALANVGLPIWQVLQNFAESLRWLATLWPLRSRTSKTSCWPAKRPRLDRIHPLWHSGRELDAHYWCRHPDDGLLDGHGATATAAGAVFNAPPASNPSLGVSNTLNAGDDLEATGAAAGDTTLNYTAVTSGRLAIRRSPPA